MKKTVKTNITEMRNLVKNMPKTINETLNFEANDELGSYEEEEMPEEESVEEPKEEGMDIMAFVDDIRKKSLKGMASLAETPDDERYQLLKKIWQICDKKPEQQTAFGNPQNAQGQQMNTAAIQHAVNESLFNFFNKKKKEDKKDDEEDESSDGWNKAMKNAKKSSERFSRTSTSSISKSNGGKGSSDPFGTKNSGWKGDKQYHDAAGVKSNSDKSKDWMFGDR